MKLNQLLIASGNKDKVGELKKLLELYNLKILSALDFGLPEPEETGSTFIENANLKSKYYANQTNIPSLADDSGMCVEELGGEPGVYSARFAGINKDFNFAFDKIQRMLQEKGLSSARASFHCALSLCYPGAEPVAFEGRVDGVLSFPARGEFKFGYDPIFIPNGYSKTFAEMDRDLKSKISHRSIAFNKFIKEFLS